MLRRCSACSAVWTTLGPTGCPDMPDIETSCAADANACAQHAHPWLMIETPPTPADHCWRPGVPTRVRPVRPESERDRDRDRRPGGSRQETRSSGN